MLSKRNQKKFFLIFIIFLAISVFFLLNFNFYLSNFIISNFSYRSDYLSETDNLKKKISSLQAKVKIQEAIINENKNLKDQLNFKKSLNYEILSGELTIISPFTFASTGIINLGSKDGIKKDFLVIKPQGLIGKISVVNNGSSEVLFPSNPSFTLMVYIGEEKIPGILKGNGISSIIKYVTNDKEVKIGDKVFISNNSKENYPNIEFGKISKIIDKKGFFNINIKTFVDPRNSKNILVIKND